MEEIQGSSPCSAEILFFVFLGVELGDLGVIVFGGFGGF